jgi:hypothetical protein
MMGTLPISGRDLSWSEGREEVRCCLSEGGTRTRGNTDGDVIQVKNLL